MINVKMNFDEDGFRRSLNKALENGIRDSVTNKLAPLQVEMAAEPGGRFIVKQGGQGVIVIPEGFTPELTEKINALFK